LRFPSRRPRGGEAWRRIAGNLAAISAIRPVKIRTAEIAIGPAAGRPEWNALRKVIVRIAKDTVDARGGVIRC
jgi:hypothetical protein